MIYLKLLLWGELNDRLAHDGRLCIIALDLWSQYIIEY